MHKNLDYKAYKPMLDKFMIYSHNLFEDDDKAFYQKQGLKVEDRQKSPVKILIDREQQKQINLQKGKVDGASSPARTQD